MMRNSIWLPVWAANFPGQGELRDALREIDTGLDEFEKVSNDIEKR